VKDDDRIS